MNHHKIFFFYKRPFILSMLKAVKKDCKLVNSYKLDVNFNMFTQEQKNNDRFDFSFEVP